MTERKSNPDAAVVSRRGFLRSLGTRSAAVVVAGPAMLAASVAHAQDCPEDAVVFSNAIVGTVADGSGTDYSPTTGLERTAVPSACWQCVCRDGIIGFVEDGRLHHIEGNPALKRGMGKICARGQGGVGQAYDPDRLLFPMRRVAGTERGAGQWERITYEEALTELAAKMAEVRADDPGRFMFHYGRMKASSDKMTKTYFLPAYGSKSYGGHTSICESNKWTSQELVWGKHYDVADVSRSGAVLIFGSNPLITHTSHIPLSTRLSNAMKAGVPVYTFDPRLTETAANSTEWVPLTPGTDLAVVLAMAYHIVTSGLVPPSGTDFINEWTNIDKGTFDTRMERLQDLLEHPDQYIGDLAATAGFNPYWDAADQPSGGYTPAWAEGISGVPASKIEAIAEVYANASPGATIISYRGAVMHFNGTMTENAVQMLEGICGNIDVEGGRVHAVGASWSYKTTYPVPGGSTSGSSHDRKSQYVAASHGTSHQVLDTIAEEDAADRPSIYLVYCYTPAYANGDMQRQIDVLKDQSIIPYLVVCDVAYSEAAMYADLLLPDTTYLERWDWEDMVSFDQIHEYYIRQPIIEPLGGVRNFQDLLIDLAGRLSAGGGDPLEGVAAIGSMQNFVQAACNDTAVVNDAGVAAGYANGFEFMKDVGAWWDPTETPKYRAYQDEVTVTITDPTTIDDADAADYTWQDDEGIVWEGTKAEYNTGYRNVSKSYGHYKGQAIDDSGTIYKGFAPDKINKSGWFELDSKILLAKGYPGMPVWMPIPEHEGLTADELFLLTFKMPTQTHSRTQNCKYLSEITHHEPCWINPTTAAALGVTDGGEMRLTLNRELYNDKDLDPTKKMGSEQTSMVVEAKVTSRIHPRAIAISHHLGHWAYGRYASGNASPVASDADQAAQIAADTDATEMWWDKHGFRGNWITPNAGDPIGGGLRYFDVVVSVEAI